jgi:hypothetical protein
MKAEWVASIRDQCKKAEIAFFFKQWGGVRKSLGGRRLEGRTYDEFPRREAHPVASADKCLALISQIESRVRNQHNRLKVLASGQPEYVFC